ncbi:MAG: hypothetical protein ACRD1S_02625 [Vicinamibacterales bacterium]
MSVRPGFRRAAIVAFAILLPVAAWALWDYVEGARLARLIREIHDRGEPVAVYEIVPLPVPLTEEQARASRYYLAAAILASDVYDDGKIVPDAVERFADALVMLDRATPVDFSQLQPGTEFSYRTADFLQLSRLNAMRTESRARAGDGDAAAASLVASIRLRRVMETSTPVTWAVSADANFLSVAGVMLGESQPSAEALRSVQEALEKATRPSVVEDGIVAMRGRAIQRFWREYFGGTVVPTARGAPRRLPLRERIMRPWRTHRFVATLGDVERRLEAARQPWPRKLDAFEVPRAGRDAPVPAIELPDPKRAATRLASDRVAIAALAVERFRRRPGGATPASLSELSPEFLTSIPDDPFSEKPLIYRREQAGYVVYSVGANRADDGGAVGPNESDLGLRVSARQR